jgi:LacI family transcriptional regulator
MVCSDQRGPQFLEACRRAGVSVPDEVAVLGVDDDEPLCEICNPPLSSVNPAHHRVGYEAARLLARLMAGKAAPREPVFTLPAGVTTRLSTEVFAIEDRPLATALRLIREHCCDGLDVEAIARRTGLSRSVLQRRFRATLKRSVHQEILQARLKRAMDLLAASNLPLADVAERTGFKHQEYLGAVFKARTGQTPAEYRKERRG